MEESVSRFDGNDSTWLNPGKGCQCFWNEQLEIIIAIAFCSKNQYRNSNYGKVLLRGESFINCHENIKVFRRRCS